MRLVDVGIVLKVRETKNGRGYIYVIEGKNSVYKVFSKKYFDEETVVYVYSGDDGRYFISER